MNLVGKVCNKHPELHGQRYKDNKCTGCVKSRQQKHYESNKESIKSRISTYRRKNKESVSRRKSEYDFLKRHTDPIYCVKSRIRTLVKNSLRFRGFKKDTKTFDILGCTPVEFAAHIESKFTCGMSWENRHLWHIDHIIPLASAKTEEEIYKLNHYTNLQPLWAKDNESKGARQ